MQKELSWCEIRRKPEELQFRVPGVFQKIHHFSGCIQLRNIFFCSKIAHTSSKECTALTLGCVSGSSIQVIYSHHLACHGSYDLYHRFCFNSSKKYNCFSLSSSEFGVAAFSSFSRVFLIRTTECYKERLAVEGARDSSLDLDINCKEPRGSRLS